MSPPDPSSSFAPPGPPAVPGPPAAVRVTIPATSANLGPGFDACGLALGLYDEVEARIAAAGLSVEVEGTEQVPYDESHLVVRAMRAGFDALGVPQPGLALRCVNRIPHSRGLGSSAAAIVAGVCAADALAAGMHPPGALPGPAAGGPLGRDGVLRLAAEIEGHPDNVAAAVLGGFTVAWRDGDSARAVRAEPLEGLQPVVFVPTARQSTAASRAALPERVSHADAAWSAGRAALLALAITGQVPAAFGAGMGAGTGGSDMDSERAALLAATEDRLHQPYRLAAAPGTRELVERLRGAGIPAVLSGSGPTVLALAVSRGQAAAAAAASTPGFAVFPLAVDRSGARVERLTEDCR